MGLSQDKKDFLGPSYRKVKWAHGRPDLRKQRAWGKKWDCTRILSDEGLKGSNPKYLKQSRGFIISLRSSSRGMAQMASLGLCSLKFWLCCPFPCLPCHWLCSIDSSVFRLEKMTADSLSCMSSWVDTNIGSKGLYEGVRLVPCGHVTMWIPWRLGWARRAWW